ncbi:MAG TPA: YidC/Oxa1 family insertase periplasmic-domain containing protein [Gemmatimonadaceae bacterium]|nr:YidC/Oxa1 family insertase periplasmic-domain containing protein [Gemmatimonadaceae bacterium]
MTRRIAIAALLIGLVLWLTPRLFPTPPQRPVPTPAAAAGPAAASAVPLRDSAATAGSGPVAALPNGSTAAPAAAALPGAAARPDTTVIRDSLGEIRFSSRGASVVGAKAAKYHSLQPGAARQAGVELARSGEPLVSYQIATPAGIVPLADASFSGAQIAAGRGVEYTTTTPAGNVDIRYAVVPDSYVVHVTGRVAGAPAGSALLVTLPQGLASAEVDTLDDIHHYAIAYKRTTSDATGVPFTKLDPGERQEIPGPLTWAVTKSKYFMVAIAAPDTLHPLGAMTITGGPRSSKVVTHMTGVVQVPLRDGAFSFDIYAGPQEWRRLRALGRDLDTANPYGGFLQKIVQPFATIVMRALLWLHETFRMSYGWVLVLFGVMIRLLTWPLNQSAMRTSLKMQRVQPQLQELQKRYKGDPQRLNTEMMKLYREHDMSPFSSLAGCMPMLIPMPILFALFYVFQNTIEFRGVPFLWLPDISLKDPYYILPVLMGLSMFVLSWIGMRSAPPNPQTKMMAYIMPLVMTVIFFRFPSGLNLYYTVQNMVTIPQQWLLSKERAKNGSTVATSAPAAARGRR